MRLSMTASVLASCLLSGAQVSVYAAFASQFPASDSTASTAAAAAAAAPKSFLSMNTPANSNKRQLLNPAMGDTAFLRKRTSNLLNGDITHATSKAKNSKQARNTFHWLIDAWAFSGEIDAADHATALLNRMEELKDTLAPDVRSYTKVMNALSRSGRPDAGSLADELFRKMSCLHSAAQPNSFTYTALLEAHANSGDAKKAEEILDLMILSYQTSDQNKLIQPTGRNFNACISAYAKTGQALLAEAVYTKMEEHYQIDGNKQAQPNAFHSNSVITAWANCPDEGSAQRAENVLQKMPNPTTVSFNAVIDAWAKSGVDDAAEHAEELLRHMEHLYESEQNVLAKPNVRSFNTVINVWAKSKREDAAQKAEGVLCLMKRLYEEGNDDVKPDVHSFSTVINAWARSQTRGKAERAFALFREMNDLYLAGNKSLKPNVVAYNAVMNACAWTTDGDVPEQTKAMEIAHLVLMELESSPNYGRPDQVTYGTFLKVCATQMAECDSRRTIVEMVFKKCCRDGQVGNMVLTQLQQVVSDVEYKQITGRWPEAEIKVEELPQEWWCNVVEGKYQRRKRREELQEEVL